MIDAFHSIRRAIASVRRKLLNIPFLQIQSSSADNQQNDRQKSKFIFHSSLNDKDGTTAGARCFDAPTVDVACVIGRSCARCFAQESPGQLRTRRLQRCVRACPSLVRTDQMEQGSRFRTDR